MAYANERGLTREQMLDNHLILAEINFLEAEIVMRRARLHPERLNEPA